MTATTDTKPAKGKKPKPSQPQLVAREATAADLLAHLEESGTPAAIVRQTRDKWLRHNEDATAEELFRFLDAPIDRDLFRPGEVVVAVTEGTLRKAGRWIWGPEFEPSCAVSQVPEEEIVKLRQENDRHRDNLAEEKAQRLALIHKVDFLQGQLDDANRRVAFLSAGRSRAELDTLGAGQNTTPDK